MKRLTILLSAAALMLTGATMTSCVKNDESQSVTNIRDAKALQLLALAQLSSAKAEAELILANSDKVLKESEAALNKAKAAVEQAKADKDQVAVEDAKLALEKVKADHKLEMDRLIAVAEKAKLEALQALKKYVDDNAALNVTNKALQNLTTAYAAEYTVWNGLVNDLVTAKVALSNAELGLVDIKTTKANETAEKEIVIASAKAMIEKLKTVDVTDKAKTQKALDDALAVEAAALAQSKSATAAQKAPEEAQKTAFNAYTSANTPYAAAVALVTAEDATAISFKAPASVKDYEHPYTINGTALKAIIPSVGSYVAIDKYDETKIAAVKAGAGASDALKAACDLVIAQKANYDAAIKTAQDTELPLQEAKAAVTVTGAVYGEATRVQLIYTTLISGYADVPALIAAEEVKITGAQKAIADIKTIANQEQLITFQKGEVARLTTEIAASQKQLDIFKAAIEAELKK